jgi:hypothetical protein
MRQLIQTFGRAIRFCGILNSFAFIMDDGSVSVLWLARTCISPYLSSMAARGTRHSYARAVPESKRKTESDFNNLKLYEKRLLTEEDEPGAGAVEDLRG